MEKISTKDITFLLQGAYDEKYTDVTVASIRKYFSGAKILLSTWAGTKINKEIPLDDLIENDDPGGTKDKKVNFVNNLKRQLISTQNGLKRVDSKYVVKLRTDLVFNSDKLLSSLFLYPQKKEVGKTLLGKIVIPSFFSKRFLTSLDGNFVQLTPFHFSDWLAFGLLEDVNNIYNVDLPNEEYCNYFFDHTYMGNKINLMAAAHRYAPEQYIFYSAYKKLISDPVEFNDYMDYSEVALEASDRFLTNNFIVLTPQQLGLYCLKSSTRDDLYKKWTKEEVLLPYHLWDGLISNLVYEKLYKKYCDSTFRISILSELRQHIEKVKIARLKKCHQI